MPSNPYIEYSLVHTNCYIPLLLNRNLCGHETEIEDLTIKYTCYSNIKCIACTGIMLKKQQHHYLPLKKSDEITMFHILFSKSKGEVLYDAKIKTQEKNTLQNTIKDFQWEYAEQVYRLQNCYKKAMINLKQYKQEIIKIYNIKLFMVFKELELIPQTQLPTKLITTNPLTQFNFIKACKECRKKYSKNKSKKCALCYILNNFAFNDFEIINKILQEQKQIAEDLKTEQDYICFDKLHQYKHPNLDKKTTKIYICPSLSYLSAKKLIEHEERKTQKKRQANYMICRHLYRCSERFRKNVKLLNIEKMIQAIQKVHKYACLTF
ncbi:hypothetical protein AB837_00405 [bacterium AB1]|nr:hypothetical protein AB837_00405 [bacterium AB1]